MSNIEVDLMEVQRGLEAESRALGQSRYRSQRSAPWADVYGPEVDEGALPPGRAMIRRALQPTAEAIERFFATAKKGSAGPRHQAYNLIHALDPDPAALAYLTLRCGLQAAAQQSRLQKAAGMVARAVKDHLQARQFAVVNPGGAAGLQRSLAKRSRVSSKRQRAIAGLHEAEGVALHWSPKDEFLLGAKLLDLAIEATGLFELRLITTRQGKKVTREQQFQVAEQALEWLEQQHERCELLDPLPLPMVVPPRPWTTSTNGGYLTPPLGNQLVRSRSRAYLEELKHASMDDVYRAVNAVQATAWRINRPILTILEQIEADGGGLAGLPRRDPEAIPQRPADAAEDSDALRDWKRMATQVHARNAASRSKRLDLAQRLWVARKLIDYAAIYFPHHCDWRGRVYPIPQAGPNPQAGDVGRSLLEFAEGKPLGPTGARWLAIHVANVFGIDKVSFADRIAWVEDHRAEILDSAADPLDGARFWTTAPKPWAALAACFEWAGYCAQGDTFVSHLPIALDGSNSGLQHLTALLRDADAAPHVNLIQTSQPGDIYAVVAARVQAIADACTDPDATPWKHGRITRGIVKRPCMTFVYSVSAIGMADQIMGEVAALDRIAQDAGRPPHLNGADNFLAARWLAGQLLREIGSTVAVAKSGMDWLKAAGKAISSIDLPLWWTTPAGLPVLQRYSKSAAKTVETIFRGQRLQLKLDDDAGPGTLSDWLEQEQPRSTDTKRVGHGVVPNFVHSLDAAHLMLVAIAARDAGIWDLAVIHDSFATHAAETDRLSAILRKTFVDMYDDDPLARFRAELLGQLTPTGHDAAQALPLPARGQLDLRSVLDAAYMFA
jgi:DNA-directed RNA polymerase, mitochondrial